jgi:hypothetical protein
VTLTTPSPLSASPGTSDGNVHEHVHLDRMRCAAVPGRI